MTDSRILLANLLAYYFLCWAVSDSPVLQTTQEVAPAGS